MQTMKLELGVQGSVVWVFGDIAGSNKHLLEKRKVTTLSLVDHLFINLYKIIDHALTKVKDQTSK